MKDEASYICDACGEETREVLVAYRVADGLISRVMMLG